MASSAASSVRPPRPKKEPQTLVIPKNAAEEQKLKLERLMKNPQKLDAEFQKRLEKNKIAAEEQTAKRRKKRQKLKEKKLLAKKMKLEQKKQEGPGQPQEQGSSSSAEASGTEEEEEEVPSFIMGR
ncbi:PRKR-interacting protein 1 isoform X5 [Macaca fascicularis]|uniref:PRKR-interacting protein 1 isoform X5 n=1 Tax=Macaca fascicularis TaxID=9541 RepID=UPI0003AB6674